MVVLLVDHLVQLGHLPKDSFLRFRPALEGASGAESKQGGELVRGARHVHVLAIRAALRAARTHPGTVHTADCLGPVCAVSAGLDGLLVAIGDWRSEHLKIATHFIDDLPGTGGTSGVAYLRKALIVMGS
jgi:tryptophan 2,3-dioxygenase